MPGMTHWQHPRFFGYFPASGSLASVLGDMASTALSSIGLNWQASPALTEVEQVMTDWLRDLMGLPNTFSGVLQDTASAASFVALVSARERANGYAAARGGLQSGTATLMVYTSQQSHSSIEKAALLAGFGREQVRAIPGDAVFRMDVSALRAAMAEDRAAGRQPAAVVATSGTTAVTAFDPIAEIAALTAPEGVAVACSLYLVRDPEHLVRVMSTNPSYLQTAVDREVRNYRDWGIPLGRRFRALKIWFTLRDLGTEAIRARLRDHIQWAQDLAATVSADPEWRVVAPVTLQTVCIRHEPAGLTGEALDAHTRTWAQRLNDSGMAYVTPAVIGGRWTVRVSIGAESTRAEHITELWSLLRAAVVSTV